MLDLSTFSVIILSHLILGRLSITSLFLSFQLSGNRNGQKKTDTGVFKKLNQPVTHITTKKKKSRKPVSLLMYL